MGDKQVNRNPEICNVLASEEIDRLVTRLRLRCVLDDAYGEQGSSVLTTIHMNERKHTPATSPPQLNALPLEEPTIMRPSSEAFQCCYHILSHSVCVGKRIGSRTATKEERESIMSVLRALSFLGRLRI